VTGRIIRRHSAEGTESDAVYSACERYRYALTRVWDASAPRLLFVMLNPSTATEIANDPTVERCERRARLLGYGAMRITNIFAWRETDPARLKRAPAPEGPDNIAMLEASVAGADAVLCAWGVHGAHLAQGARVADQLAASGKPLLALGETRDGHPRHPLYVSYATQPRPWPVTAQI
jgi:hypothetical protein